MGLKGGPALLYRCDFAHAIGKKAQGSLCSNAGIELAHRTGGRIARVHKGFLPFFALCNALALALVQGFEIIAPHVDLAPHFKHWRCTGGQAQRNLANGADVLRYILSIFPVSAGGCLHQHAVLVTQVHGQAVKFEFDHILHRRIGFSQTELFANPGVKIVGPGGFGIGLGADAEHGYRMTHWCELVQRFATHPLCG